MPRLKINQYDLFMKLQQAGLPVKGVQILDNGQPLASFQIPIVPEQRAKANQIIQDYDQAAEDAAKVAKVTGTGETQAPLTLAEIEAAKSITDLKALLIKAFHITE